MCISLYSRVPLIWHSW